MTMILCVGTSGSGKSVLLKCLMGKESKPADLLLSTLPTVGTDLITLTQVPVKKNSPPKELTIREVGGSMAPLWHSYVESGNIRGILYIVDASSPETVGASTIYLIELLSHAILDGVEVLLVFTKTDLKSGRSLSEMKAIMRLEQIMALPKRNVTSLTFNTATMENLEAVYTWAMKFSVPKETVK